MDSFLQKLAQFAWPDGIDSIELAKSILVVICGLGLLWSTGCGSIREHRATAQLLLSDAVDRSVANIDFGPLANEKVYLDTRFVQFKNESTVTTNYVISSLRQQMVVAGCLLQERVEDADYVVEARVGTMGSDGYDINYGIPASGPVSSAASLVSSSNLPPFPEISIAKRTEDMAAVKLAVFAYESETKEPVWQSGTSLAKSEASGTWILGAGPFKRGSIYDGTQFAGKKLRWRGRAARSDLMPQDYTYRDTSLWDPKLREKVANGEQLIRLSEPVIGGQNEPESNSETADSPAADADLEVASGGDGDTSTKRE